MDQLEESENRNVESFPKPNVSDLITVTVPKERNSSTGFGGLVGRHQKVIEP